MSLKHIKVIGFDADDTLWVNEPYFQDIEKQFSQPSSRITILLRKFIGNNCPACNLRDFNGGKGKKLVAENK